MGSIRVLIVDDEPAIVTLLERILAKDPIFEFASATRGFQAINLATQRKFDAIICDIGLPDMDGAELIQELRNRKICPPFVMFISGAVKSAPANITGNTIFIRKPFNPADIVSTLIRFAPRT